MVTEHFTAPNGPQPVTHVKVINTHSNPCAVVIQQTWSVMCGRNMQIDRLRNIANCSRHHISHQRIIGVFRWILNNNVLNTIEVCYTNHPSQWKMYNCTQSRWKATSVISARACTNRVLLAVSTTWFIKAQMQQSFWYLYDLYIYEAHI